MKNTKIKEIEPEDNLEVTLNKLGKSEPWLDRHWRQGAAIVYFIICIFDFLVMPIVVENRINDLNAQALLIIAANPEALAVFQDAKLRHWEPLTLQSRGLFHLSFGAILTGAVVMRGQERKTTLSQLGRKLNSKK